MGKSSNNKALRTLTLASSIMALIVFLSIGPSIPTTSAEASAAPHAYAQLEQQLARLLSPYYSGRGATGRPVRKSVNSETLTWTGNGGLTRTREGEISGPGPLALRQRAPKPARRVVQPLLVRPVNLVYRRPLLGRTVEVTIEKNYKK